MTRKNSGLITSLRYFWLYSSTLLFISSQNCINNLNIKRRFFIHNQLFLFAWTFSRQVDDVKERKQEKMWPKRRLIQVKTDVSPYNCRMILRQALSFQGRLSCCFIQTSTQLFEFISKMCNLRKRNLLLSLFKLEISFHVYINQKIFCLLLYLAT